MEKGKSIIEVRNLTKSFTVAGGEVAVLSDIDLEVYENELLVIFGPSGCGKTTLLNTVMGLEKPTTGDVSFLGFQTNELEEDDLAMMRKQHIGIIYQHQYWIKSLNVVENVAVPLLLEGIDRKSALDQARERLHQVNLEGRERFKPSELSSGEQQRVSLARALISDPRVIIADEPTGNLDYNSGIQMLELLKGLTHEHGKTIILVTHNIEHIDFADRVVFMMDGKIKQIYVKGRDNTSQIKHEITDGASKYANHGAMKVGYPVSAPAREAGPNGSRTSILTRIRTRLNRVEVRKSRYKARRTLLRIWNGLLFVTLFLVHLGNMLLMKLFDLIQEHSRLAPLHKISAFCSRFLSALSNRLTTGQRGHFINSITDTQVIELSFRNLLNKKSRTLVTVFGMGLGIGFIVFLVSIGYGLERLVISRVATLDELKHIDVHQAVSSDLFMTDDTISTISALPKVDKILPQISIASRVKVGESFSDVVANGVQSEFLETSGYSLQSGKIFDSNDITKQSKTTIINDAVVNERFLLTYGLDSESAIGRQIEITFVGTQLSSSDSAHTPLSDEGKMYTIVGVVTDSKPATLYIPIVNLKELGLTRYSQLRVIAADQRYQSDLRKRIEVLGYSTVSINDTISQVESFFVTVRSFLFVIGLVALVVSMLGMFNTLTVSLLERTREIGFMKVIGMRSEEVMKVFLTESMIMSVLGGVAGIVIGVLAGEVMTLLLSYISVSRGDQAIDVSATPFILLVVVIIFSTGVGVFTGLFPARRATKIAALNALRYE